MSGKQYLSSINPTHTAVLLCTIMLLVCTSVISVPAFSAIYKCVDSSGNTTYSGMPCAVDESTQKISRSATAIPGLECRVASKLTDDTITRMRNGESIQAVYDTHGGLNNLSTFVVSLVNYVYTFRSNETTTDERIARLTTERCQVGSFGNDTKSCSVYPTAFIDSLGGCATALSTTAVTTSALGTQYQTTQNLTALPSDHYSLPALGEAKPTYVPGHIDTGRPANEFSARDECRQRLRNRLIATAQEMQQSEDPSARARLRKRQTHLSSQLTQC